MIALLRHQAASEVLLVLSLIGRQKLKFRWAFDFRGGARDYFVSDAVEVPHQFIPGAAFLLRARVGMEQGRLAFESREASLAHKDVAKFRLILEEAQHVEFGALVVLAQRD